MPGIYILQLKIQRELGILILSLFSLITFLPFGLCYLILYIIAHNQEKDPGARVSMLASYYVLAFLPLLFLDSVFLASESLVGVTSGSSSLDSEAGLLISVIPILMI